MSGIVTKLRQVQCEGARQLLVYDEVRHQRAAKSGNDALATGGRVERREFRPAFSTADQADRGPSGPR
jgi:hypothetical protein